MTALTVNGRPVRFDIDPQTPLLWALRDAANLTGTKYGCGVGDCHACTVMVDGEVVLSGGEPTRVDMRALRGELAELMKMVDADFVALEKRQAPAIPVLLEANRKLTRTNFGVNRFAGGGSQD